VGRTKLACELLGQYLPQDVYEELLATYEYVPDATFPGEMLTGQISLARLDAHVKTLANEQSLVVSDGIKKSKAGPEAKKRKKGSQGVEKLKKANVSGMSKLSTFFTRKGE